MAFPPNPSEGFEKGVSLSRRQERQVLEPECLDDKMLEKLLESEEKKKRMGD
ncbi:hypothetical protein Acr_16g0002100 [Actinidia rufa]|uniref:Uncharacterized protein n=1 Tax=Actinidia rufa TaxID=165716 RepID=A0A7J0FY52_9ERIC|nr:hypothetical protein Acr_16g0002100 [Actinidia rufa]